MKTVILSLISVLALNANATATAPNTKKQLPANFECKIQDPQTEVRTSDELSLQRALVHVQKNKFEYCRAAFQSLLDSIALSKYVSSIDYSKNTSYGNNITVYLSDAEVVQNQSFLNKDIILLAKFRINGALNIGEVGGQQRDQQLFSDAELKLSGLNSDSDSDLKPFKNESWVVEDNYSRSSRPVVKPALQQTELKCTVEDHPQIASISFNKDIRDALSAKRNVQVEFQNHQTADLVANAKATSYQEATYEFEADGEKFKLNIGYGSDHYDDPAGDLCRTVGGVGCGSGSSSSVYIAGKLSTGFFARSYVVNCK